MNDRDYEESLVNEQIDRVRRLDKGTLLATTGREPNLGRDDRIPLVITYHPTLNSVGKTLRDFHPMLSNSEEQRVVFPEPPVTTFRRCKSLTDMLVRARLTNNNNCDTMGCACCEKSRSQVYQSMSDSDSFHSLVTKKEYKITFTFNCDSSNVVYLFDCVVCGFSMCVVLACLFRLRLNNYKACYRRFRSGSSVPQMGFFGDIMGFWKIFVLL